MATLKLIATRLKSIKNIQKITQSMKMIAASRYAKVERELKPVRDYGASATALYDKLEMEAEEPKKKHMIIAVSSDRGLCGAIHSNISKAVKSIIEEKKDCEIKILVIGDKSKVQLQRTHSKNILMSVNEYGRKTPTFEEASRMATALLDLGYEFETAEILYNKFRSVVSYKTTSQPIVPFDTLAVSEKLNIYDDVDSDVLRNYTEFQLVSILFHCLMEGNCSEQSARMTSMDSATKNAGEIIEKLTLKFNRTRQAVITRELIEIISGASAI